MVLRPLQAFALAFVLALAGCSDDPGGDESTTSSSSGTTTVASNGTSSSQSNTTAANVAPILKANVTSINGTVPLTVNITINGTDANGDPLTWNVTLNGTGVANGTKVPGNASITITTAGLHKLNVTLSDGKLSNTTTFTINATAGGPTIVTVDDPDGDAEQDFSEIEDFTVQLINKNLELLLHVADIPTGMDGTAFAPWGYRLTINGEIYRCYNYAGTNTWSAGESAYIGGCTWDAAADTVRMVIAVSRLEDNDVKAPYTLNLASYHGALNNEAQVDDLVPDTGTVVLG